MKRALIQLHVAVFLAGFTAILGKLIQLNEVLLVWYRILITVTSLFFLLRLSKQWYPLEKNQVYKLMGIGVVIAFHWICFYGSIKLANVSIALVCFASVSLFTAILEPIALKHQFNWFELFLGLIGLMGLYLIFFTQVKFQSGIWLGLLSGLLAALFSVLNKSMILIGKPKMILFYELLGGGIVLSIFIPIYIWIFQPVQLLPSFTDLGWLLILSWVCTIWAMDLMLKSLKKISAFTQNLSLNLEPVYGILMAFFLFHENEHLGNSFYLGFGVIILTVLIQLARLIFKNKAKVSSV